MAETNRRNKKTIKFQSGLPFFLKDGDNDWENLGENISNKLTRKTDKAEVTLKGGDSFKRVTKRSCDVNVVLAQVEKIIVDRVEELDGRTVKLYIPNGIINDNDEGYYFPEAELSLNADIDMVGDKVQELSIDFSIMPQASNISIVPQGNMPSACPSTSGAAVTGNTFYAIIKTAVTENAEDANVDQGG
jgi:hypothetical protein